MSFLSGLLGRKHAAIGPTEARRGVDGGAVLLDVREPSESRAGHALSNLSGGMRAWSAAGRPVVAKGGRPGSVT